MSIKYDESIKRPSEEIEYTEDMVKDLLKCSTNIYDFIEHVKIIHPDRGKITFNPYSFQKEIIDKYLQNRYMVVKVSRQQGKCVFRDISLKIKNKRTQEVEEITIEEFFERFI